MEPSRWNTVVGISIISCGIVANVLLLLAMYKDPLKCFSNSTSYFIANLAFSDVLNLLFYLSEFCLYIITTDLTYSTQAEMEAKIAVNHLFFLSTFWSILCLSLERFLSIAWPLWHNVHMTPKVCRYWVMLSWLPNILVVGIDVILMRITDKNNIDIFFTLAGVYTLTIFLASFLFYVLACASIRRHRLRITTRQDNNTSHVAQRAAELRLRNESRFINTVLIVIIFLVFGLLPTILIYFGGPNTVEKLTKWFWQCLDVLYFINLAINPFIYIWRLPKYRKTFVVMYLKCNA